MVEARGFEPLTPALRTRCSPGLSYAPTFRRHLSRHSDIVKVRFDLIGKVPVTYSASPFVFIGKEWSVVQKISSPARRT